MDSSHLIYGTSQKFALEATNSTMMIFFLLGLGRSPHNGIKTDLNSYTLTNYTNLHLDFIPRFYAEQIITKYLVKSLDINLDCEFKKILAPFCTSCLYGVLPKIVAFNWPWDWRFLAVFDQKLKNNLWEMLQNNSLPINIKNWWENERKKNRLHFETLFFSPWGQEKLSNHL